MSKSEDGKGCVMVETPQQNFTPTRILTAAEVRQIISQRKGGQTIGNIASGMNLIPAIVVRVVQGEAYQEISAPIFARMIFPGISPNDLNVG